MGLKEIKVRKRRHLWGKGSEGIQVLARTLDTPQVREGKTWNARIRVKCDAFDEDVRTFLMPTDEDAVSAAKRIHRTWWGDKEFEEPSEGLEIDVHL